MYAAIIDGIIHYSSKEKEGYQELAKSNIVNDSEIKPELGEKLQSDILEIKQSQAVTDAALQELILNTMGGEV